MQPMTVMGEKLLQKELRKLKTEDRPRLIQAIADARAHGDLKENAEYRAAREEQGMVEFRIRMIESRLSQKRIIDVTHIAPNNKVIFGTTVTLVKQANKARLRYQIVGEDEADIEKNKISYASPLAKALMGKELGTRAELVISSGRVHYLIEKIEHI